MDKQFEKEVWRGLVRSNPRLSDAVAIRLAPKELKRLMQLAYVSGRDAGPHNPAPGTADMPEFFGNLFR